jgi:hypothetical protein
MKMYGGEGTGQIHVFLTSTLRTDEQPASCFSCFWPGKEPPGTQQRGGWMGPRASLDDAEKSL